MKRLPLVLLLAVAPALLSAATHGRLRLAVATPDGGAAANVAIAVHSDHSLTRRSAVTRSNGTALLDGLAPGRYRIEIETHGGASMRIDDVEIRQNEETSVEVRLPAQAVLEESLTVRAEGAIVNVRTSSLAEFVSIERVDPIPIGRDYVAWSQLVPGVGVIINPSGLETPREPASRAGNNYNDRGGNPGSRDNVYFLEGFNITDMNSGSGRLALNTEIVLEQEVATSAVDASHAGGRGYVANIVTRSGANELQASLSAFLQTPSMVADYDHDDSRLQSVHDDLWDGAATAGGRVIRDRSWFFLSLQHRDTQNDIELSTSATPQPRTESYSFDRTNTFAKLSLAATPVDSAALLYFADDRETSGSRNVNTPPNRYTRVEEKPELIAGSWQRAISDRWFAELRAGSFDLDILGSPEYPSLGPANTIVYPPGEQVPAYLRDLGGAGGGSRSVQKKDQFDVSSTFAFDLFGEHVVRAGAGMQNWSDSVGNYQTFGHSLVSLAPALAGISFGDVIFGGLLAASEFDSILRALQSQQSSAAFAAVDSDRDGVVTAEELRAVVFATSNAGGVNFLRTSDLRVGVNEVKQKSRSFHLQDDWSFGSFNVEAGIRGEDYDYIASDGSTIVDMDPMFAPRIGASWDVGRKGRQRLSLFYGRYYDPLLMPIVHFAGNLSGTVRSEEVFLGGDWFSYRVRGSATVRDAVFAPNLEHQHQDEIAATWAMNFTPRLAVLVHAYMRRDGKLIEDYDPFYFNRDAAGALALTPADFGFDGAGPTGANYFVGNLVGGKRRTDGVDLAVDRRSDGTWSGAFHYSWKDAKGNTSSDGNTDLQGDFLALDPRHPYMYGRLPGSIDHQIKLFGSRRLPFGFELGGLFYWNSGAHFTEADIFRPESYGILMNRLRPDGSRARTGGETHPSWYSLDARLRWIGGWRSGSIEIFADVFNVLDRQEAVLVEEGHNHPEFTRYREPRMLQEPRRYQVGVRVGF